MTKTQREGHYGKEQQGLPELRQENEAAVYRLTALQMRYELEKRRGVFRANAGYGLCLAATYRRREEEG